MGGKSERGAVLSLGVGGNALSASNNILEAFFDMVKLFSLLGLLLTPGVID